MSEEEGSTNIVILAELGSLHINMGLVAIDKQHSWMGFYLPCRMIGYPPVEKLCINPARLGFAKVRARYCSIERIICKPLPSKDVH